MTTIDISPRGCGSGSRRVWIPAMTPDQIAAMEADAEAGTPGGWRVSAKTPTAILRQDGERLFKLHQGFKDEYRNEANARRIARVPLMESTIIAQAAEIARLREALGPLAAMADRYDPDDGDGDYECWSGLAVPKIKHLRAARAALEATP